MKKISLILNICVLAICFSCQRIDWAEGTPSSIIAIEDVRLLYQDEDLVLSNSILTGASKITGVIISDATSGNLSEGELVIQNTRRKRTRGISLYVGSISENYKPGDSVAIHLTGAILTKEKGMLKLKELPENPVELISTGNPINPQRVSIKQLINTPTSYENTLTQIYSGDFVSNNNTFSGDKKFSDGSGSIFVHTEPNADYADEQVPASASITGIFRMSLGEDNEAPQASLWPRAGYDIKSRTIILAWNLLGKIGNEPNSSSTINNPNLEQSILVRGPGISPASAGGSFASTFPINGDKAAAIANGSYYEFALKPKGRAKISLSALDAILRIQTNAPKTYLWSYSIDGGIHFHDIGQPYTWTAGFSDNNGIQQPQLDLLEIIDLQLISADKPIIFRLYAWGGTSMSSNNGFRIGKSLTATQHALSIEGTVIEEDTP